MPVQWIVGVVFLGIGFVLMATDGWWFGWRTPGWYIALAAGLCTVGALLVALTPSPT